jgi:hypothetical protein
MTCYHNLWTSFYQHTAHSGSIASGIASDVGHPHFHAFDSETLYLRTSPSDLTAVDIAIHCSDHRRDAFKATDNVYIADISGVPYLIAVLEVQRITVIPA